MAWMLPDLWAALRQLAIADPDLAARRQRLEAAMRANGARL